MKKTLLSITLCFLYTANGLADDKIDSLIHALKTAKADTTKIVTLNRLSDALWRTGEYDQALDYANQALNKIVIALRARRSQGDGAKQPFETQPDGAKRSPQMLGWLKKAKASAYNNIAVIYDEQGNYPKALDLYTRSLKLARQLNDKAGIATAYINIGTLYTTLPDSVPGIGRDSTEWLYERAMELQQKSLQITKEIGAAELMTHALNGIGALYMKEQLLEKAVKRYEQSAQIADSIGAKPQMVEAFEQLAVCSWQLASQMTAGNWQSVNKRADLLEKAYEYHVKYAKVKEDIFNKEKSKELGRLEMAHEYELEQIERVQREEAATKAKAKRNLTYYWVITAFLVVLFLGSMFSGWFAIGEKMAKSVIFVAVVLLFEFILVLIEPLIVQYAGGNPALTLAINSAIALLMIPVHNFLVNKLVGRVSKTSVGRRKVRRRRK